MSDGTKGGGWEGGGESDSIDRGLLEFLKEVGKNGIVVDGVIAWIDVQSDRSADELWKAQAMDRYSDVEVTAAKEALWKASEKNIGNAAPPRIGDNKKKSDIDDIHNALTKLKLAHAKPAVLATSKMVGRTPNFRGVSEESDVNDVALKVKNLEDSVNAFMKQNSDQMKALNQAVGFLSKKSSVIVNAPPVDHVSRFARVQQVSEESPSKRKRNEANVDEVINENSYASKVISQNQPGHTSTVQGIRPMTPRNRKPSKIMYGNAKVGNDEKEEILGADVDLCLVGVSKDATTELH